MKEKYGLELEIVLEVFHEFKHVEFLRRDIVFEDMIEIVFPFEYVESGDKSCGYRTQ